MAELTTLTRVIFCKYETNKTRNSSLLTYHVQCRHLIHALNTWAARAKYTTTCPIATRFPGHGCMNGLLLNVTLIRKLRGSLMCLSYFIDMLSMGVCTTRQCQTSGRLVHGLNVCTCTSPYRTEAHHKRN